QKIQLHIPLHNPLFSAPQTGLLLQCTHPWEGAPQSLSHTLSHTPTRRHTQTHTHTHTHPRGHTQGETHTQMTRLNEALSHFIVTAEAPFTYKHIYILTVYSYISTYKHRYVYLNSYINTYKHDIL